MTELITLPQGHDRRKYIGGSDVAAILGISPWRSAVDLWVDKTTPPVENGQNAAAKRRGTRLEPYILDMIREDFGIKIASVNQRYIDPELDFLAAEIDANAIADKIQTNLNTVAELAGNHQHLFVDINQIVLKATDDFTSLVKTRIADFNTAEEARLTAERERIRAEEVARLEKEAKAAQDAKAAAEKAEQKAPPVAAIEPVEVEPFVAPQEPAIHAIVVGRHAVVVSKDADLFEQRPGFTTRTEINKILGTLQEANLVRVLHFLQTRFMQVEA